VALAFVAAPARAVADQTDDNRPPTSLEQTLAEHVCSRVQASDPHDDVRERCVSLQFHALRSEFGYDLDQLTPAERGRVDATCSRLRKPENVQPYLNCLTAFLVAAREQRRGADGMAPAGLGEVQFGIPTMPAQSSTPPPGRGRFALILLTIIGAVALASAGAVAAIRLKKKKTPETQKVCQKCGEALNTGGDLCSTCRHEAGIAAKQAIAERAAEERAELERKRVEREQAEERRRQIDQQTVDLERQDEARRLDEARRQAEAQRHQADVVHVPVPVVAAIGAEVDSDAPAEHDPYAILGVPREASPQEIERAYSVAVSKYDETQVAHLGDAIQAHYRAKAAAVEQAFRQLSGTAA
jgi:DnaJ-domain-containing protein 1